MATKKEIELVCDIQRISIQVNMQGRYTVHTEYSGHVNGVYVYLRHAKDGTPVVEFDKNFLHLYLSTGYELSVGEHMDAVVEDKLSQLNRLKSRINDFLDVDADGVPV